MSGSFAPLNFGQFQAPNLVGMSNAMQEQSLNAMRQDQLLQQSGQLRAAEGERNAMRELFSRPGFDPFAPGGANELLRVAPTTGAATFQALMRARADERAGQASLHAAAASDRAAALSVRQAQAADLDRSIKLTQSFRDMLPTANAENYPAIRAAALAAVPGWAPSWPENYDAAAVRALMQKADDSLREQAERNKPAADYTIGNTRFSGATNQPIATAEARDTAREAKIRSIMETQNVPLQIAAGIADGVLVLITDPVTGQTRLFNKATNTYLESTPAPAPAPAPAAPVPVPAPLVGGPRADLTPPPTAAPTVAVPTDSAEPQRTLYQLADTPRTTGIYPALVDAAQGVTGQVNINIPGSADMIERRQAFANAQGGLIRALAVNPRYPVDEMKRIREEINISPGSFIDPVKLKARLRAVGNDLRVRLSNEERAANDTSLPPEDRRAAAGAVTSIRNFLAVLGAPERDEPPPPRPRGAANARRGEIRTPGGFILRPIQ